MNELNALNQKIVTNLLPQHIAISYLNKAVSAVKDSCVRRETKFLFSIWSIFRERRFMEITKLELRFCQWKDSITTIEKMAVMDRRP